MVKTDKAGLKYWDENWSNTQIPAMFDHTNDSLDNYVNQKLHELFKTIIGERKNIDILEIGCANSIWPVYFHKYFDANVYGLDYSEIFMKINWPYRICTTYFEDINIFSFADYGFK